MAVENQKVLKPKDDDVLSFKLLEHSSSLIDHIIKILH